MLYILMIYIICPTCAFNIGAKTIEFETKKAQICNNPDLTEEEQSIEISKVVNNLGIRRYCCRMRILTTKDLSQDILPANI
jgi:DNA-directed RNA polymerase subunit N (RpoN/RPB10)